VAGQARRLDNAAMNVRALTLDLDDTLWPIDPVIRQAEQAAQDWLARHAPATAARHDIAAMRAWRAEIARRHPELAHDLSQLRRLSIAQALQAAGDDPALAEPAFEVFFAARQRVVFYDEVPAALDRLAARYPLLAVSNGNAELVATGLSRWFVGSVSARDAGVAKPDPRIFAQACERLGLAAAQVLHVGDHLEMDVAGARGAGLHTAWVRREGAGGAPASASVSAPAHASRSPSAGGRHLVVPDLLALADLLEA
jgi:putative hydrolase of the HAD superfamily